MGGRRDLDVRLPEQLVVLGQGVRPADLDLLGEAPLQRMQPIAHGSADGRSRDHHAHVIVPAQHLFRDSKELLGLLARDKAVVEDDRALVEPGLRLVAVDQLGVDREADHRDP